MSQIKIISFDAEGTVVTPDFSQAIWHEAIPLLYAQKRGIEPAQAKTIITEEYNKIGDQRLEWYDINYWFEGLGLGSPEPVIQSCLDRISYYPEVLEVLSSLAGKYKLVIASGTPLELLHYLLRDISSYFTHIFSSLSHCHQLKNPEFYLKMCQAMNVEPGQVVHVGDNWQFDFLNAQQVGIHTFHIDRQGNNHQESLADLTQLKSRLLAAQARGFFFI
jgi:putative hydrolase of the HAD superfamily